MVLSLFSLNFSPSNTLYSEVSKEWQYYLLHQSAVRKSNWGQSYVAPVTVLVIFHYNFPSFPIWWYFNPPLFINWCQVNVGLQSFNRRMILFLYKGKMIANEPSSNGTSSPWGWRMRFWIQLFGCVFVTY